MKYKMFDGWWQKPESSVTKSKTCDMPACQKPLQAVCENTFANFMDREKTEIPEFPGSLKDLIVVKQTLGGGKSGAFLFVVNFKKSKTGKMYVLKLYANAYTATGHVNDTRPFREVYTQCAMSGTSGYNCLIGFARAPWDAVSHLFAMNTEELYENSMLSFSESLEKKKTLADGRTLVPVPANVLFMISTFTQGSPLLNLDLTTNHAIMPGLVLNLLSTMQKAERRLGNFTHWDLHADNIFVDLGCTVRTELPLMLLSDFSAQHTWDKLAKIHPDANRLNTTFKTKVWDPFMENIKETTRRLRSGKEANIFVHPPINEKRSRLEQDAIEEVTQEFSQYATRIIVYPNVTLIDFDLANSDQFPSLDPVHKGKLNSPLPIAERTLAWVLKWIPAPYVLNMLEILLTVRNSLPKHSQSDVLHILVYIYVALVYWDLTGTTTSEKRLIKLNQNADLVLNQIKLLIEQIGKITLNSIRSFFLQSIQRILPSSCRPPLYCGLAPVMTMNFAQLSTMAVGVLQACAKNPSANPLCRFENVLQAANETLKKSDVDITKLLRTIQGALLAINTDYFLQRKYFITPDIMKLHLRHFHSDATIHIHIELLWQDFLQGALLTNFVLNRFSNGRLNVSMKLLKDSEMVVRVKNGADLYVDITTNLQMTILGYFGREGDKYDLKIDKEQMKVEDGEAQPLHIADVWVKGISLKKIGTLMELSVQVELDRELIAGYNLSSFGLIRFFLRFAASPENIKIKTRGSHVEIIMSFPPSDEPLHPCVGLATDNTNIAYALNCMSAVYSIPKWFSKLLASRTVDTEALVQLFINRVEATISDVNNYVPPVKIWAMDWQPKFSFTLLPFPEQNIQSSLWGYLNSFSGLFEVKELPSPAQELILERPLDRLTEWQAASTDPTRFNKKYVEYLSSFLQETVFVDAE